MLKEVKPPRERPTLNKTGTVNRTENGIADDGDTKRAKYIEDHLLVLNKGIAEGMNIKGYFYWSLMDNFEWVHGFEKRFGLYHTDYSTQQRTLRQGNRKYLEIIQNSK